MTILLKTQNDLRCFCGRRPLLATYGLDTDGQIYIHIKVFKQRRIYGEMIVKGGTVKIRCRECNRWHRVLIRIETNEARLNVDKSPLPVSVASAADGTLRSTPDGR